MDEVKGESSMLTVVISIILLVIVMVTLIFWYMNSTESGRDVAGSYSGGGNVDSVIRACSLQCSSQEKYSFCTSPKDVEFGEKVDIGGKAVESLSLSCQDLAREHKNLGFEPCPGLC